MGLPDQYDNIRGGYSHVWISAEFDNIHSWTGDNWAWIFWYQSRLHGVGANYCPPFNKIYLLIIR